MENKQCLRHLYKLLRLLKKTANIKIINTWDRKITKDVNKKRLKRLLVIYKKRLTKSKKFRFDLGLF